jgi:hypothetical protein
VQLFGRIERAPVVARLDERTDLLLGRRAFRLGAFGAEIGCGC